MQEKTNKIFTRAKIVGIAVIFAFCYACAVLFSPATAQVVNAEAKPASEFSVYVGYAGGPFYTKKVYSKDDLWGLSDDTVYEYSTIDASKNLRKGFGQGVVLSTLFADAGVSKPVTRFVFATTDGYAGNTDGAGSSGDPWSYSALIDSTRYYYPDYPTHWSYNLHGVFDKEGLEATRVSVPSVLALKSSFLRLTSRQEADLLWNDATRMSSNAGNRLMFGSTDSTIGDARSFANMVEGVYCIMEGAAEINFANNVIQGKVGDVIDLTPSIMGTNGEIDSTIASKFYKDMQYQVSDSEKAELVQKSDGSWAIKILAEGTFSIDYAYSTSQYDTYKQYSIGSLIGVGISQGQGGDGDGGGDSDKGTGPGSGDQGTGGGATNTGGTGGGNSTGTGIGTAQNASANTSGSENTADASQMQLAGGDMEGGEGEVRGDAGLAAGDFANEVFTADVPVTPSFSAFELNLLDDPTGDPNKQIDMRVLIVFVIALLVAGFLFGALRFIAAKDHKVKVSKKDFGGAPNLREALT